MSLTSYPPDIAMEGDSARTRKSDPVTSHLAGDRSRLTLRQTKTAVLLLLLQEGSLTGTELNELYRARRDRYGWGRVAFDTPRKRAGELAADGFLSIEYQTAEGNHLPEAIYALNERGIEAVTS